MEICDEFLDGMREYKGLLEFDFVKTTRPPVTAEPMTRAHFSQLLSAAAISDDVDDRCLHLAIEGARTPREAKKPPPCLLYTSPSPRDQRGSRMPSSA